MRDYIAKRAVMVAEYITANNATVRQTAKEFNISKSTVHKDVTERLRSVNIELFNRARDVLMVNKMERHLRGGIATKMKYSR